MHEQPFTSAADAARAYLARGFEPLDLPHGAKAPTRKGWPDLRITVEQIDHYFPPGQEMNIGLQLGASGLNDVDLDCEEAVALASAFLPETGMRSGRGDRLTHYLYRAALPPRKFVLTGDNGGTIVEIRGRDQQTMVPPSMHPSGEPVVWDAFDDPGDPDEADLARRVQRLASAAVLLRFYPQEGLRHDFVGAATGFLARGGLKVGEVELILNAVIDAAGDEESGKRVEYIRSTFGSLSEGEEATGGPRLAEIAGDDAILKALTNFLDLEKDSGAGDEPAPETQAEVMLALAREAGVSPFHDARKIPYASFHRDGHRETWPVRSEEFKDWLAYRHWQVTGKPPKQTAVSEVVHHLGAEARFAGPELEVGVRVVIHEGDVYLDLVDAQWRSVRVGAFGWEVVSEPPVRFQRYKGMIALPEPARGGTLDELRSVLAVSSDEEWRLTVAYLVAAVIPDVEHPILTIHGEQGSAKSTAMRYLAGIVDPSVIEGRAAPRDEAALIQAAAHVWMLCLDNLSYLTDDQSDHLCRLVTGAGLSKRQLYTDDSDFIYSFRRVVMMTGIEQVVQRPDLGDRCLFVELDAIPPRQRRSRRALDEAYSEMQPRVLGALLDTVAKVMAIEGDIVIDELPRMADFARIGVATERVLGWPQGAFMEAYAQSREAAVSAAIEGEPVARAVLAFMKDRESWRGTATKLMVEISMPAARINVDLADRSWPKQPQMFSRRLRRAATVLRERGVDVRAVREGKQRERVLELTRVRAYQLPAGYLREHGDEGGGLPPL